MKLGKVGITSYYVVDLENESMVEDAKGCIFEDIMNAVKYDELATHIDMIKDKTLSEEDIPEFLKGEGDYEKD